MSIIIIILIFFLIINLILLRLNFIFLKKLSFVDNKRDIQPIIDPSIKDLKVDEEISSVLKKIDSSNTSLFITGKAGTGKTTLMKYFVKNTKKNVVMLAPTGLAAVNSGGQTIHSFFRFPPRLLNPEKDFKRVKKSELYKNLDIIIIDEVSMARADIIQTIDKSLRNSTNKLDQPFGGIQMIFCGDLYQLSPVVKGLVENHFFKKHYDSPYFFSAPVCKKDPPEIIELNHVYRQKDADFIKILDHLRTGVISQNQIDQINKRCKPGYQATANELIINLTTTNAIASKINKQKLNSITGNMCIFKGEKTGNCKLDSPFLEEELCLKTGAQVMFIKNDPNKRWVNGTLGKIKELNPEKIVVQTDSGEYNVEKEKWQIIEYKYNSELKTVDAFVIGEFKQYPLKLAWAITIHKSQGQTFDKVIIDLGNGAFSHGQLYVALSRCTSLEGIILRTPVKLSDNIIDKTVINFLNRVQNPSKITSANPEFSPKQKTSVQEQNSQDSHNLRPLNINNVTLKVEKENFIALTEGFTKSDKKYYSSIFTAHRDATSIQNNFRQSPKLLTPKRRNPRSEYPLSDIGLNLRTHRDFELKYLAILDTVFHIENNMSIWNRLCTEGIFDLWNPKAPFNNLDGKEDPQILLLRIFEISDNFNNEIIPGTYYDHIPIRGITLLRPIIPDENSYNKYQYDGTYSFNQIKERIRESTKNFLQEEELICNTSEYCTECCMGR